VAFGGTGGPKVELDVRYLYLNWLSIRGTTLGSPADEGHVPTGRRVFEVAEQPAPLRAVEMLLRKVRGEPYTTEWPVPRYHRVTAAPPLRDLAHATIALITTGGLVPRGNPDGIEALNATRYGAYSIEGKAALEAAQYDNPHRGYDTSWVKQDPHRLVPVDVARELEESGAIGKLHETVYSTVGVATTLAHSARMGQEIADKLRQAGVDAVILTST
jgi:glycine reductase